MSDDKPTFELVGLPLPIRNSTTLPKSDLGAGMQRALLKDQQELIEAEILQDEPRIAAAKEKMHGWNDFAKYLSDDEDSEEEEEYQPLLTPEQEAMIEAQWGML